MPNPAMVKSYVAEAAVLPYRIVKFGAADGQVLQAAAATDAAFGLADNLGQATVGARVDVIQSGIGEGEAGAAITRGALLMADASGRVITAAAAAGSNVRTIGTALVSAAAAGEIIPVDITPGSFQG
jgi:hypothetical protein